MSKYYWERGDSAVAFIDTAILLSSRIKQSCANANHKKYTFYGLQDLSRYSSELVKLCHQANQLYPSNERIATERAILLKKALGLLITMGSLFGECERTIGFSTGVLEEVSKLMEKEDTLLKGIIKSDAERAKRLR